MHTPSLAQAVAAPPLHIDSSVAVTHGAKLLYMMSTLELVHNM